VVLLACTSFAIVSTFVLSEPVHAKKAPKQKQNQVAETPDMLKEFVAHEGYKRPHYIHVPPGYNPQAQLPVLIVFHNEGSDAKSISKLAQFNNLADRFNFMVVYPEGVRGMWNDGRRTDMYQVNDVGYVTDLLIDLERRWHIDKTAVYAAGFSDGGFFAQYAALRLPGKIQAVASVAGTLPLVIMSKMRLKGNTSLLYVLGMADPIVPFMGGPIEPGKYGQHRGIGASASQCVDFWLKGNKCSTDFSQEEYANVDGKNGQTIKVARYSNCPDNHEVIIYAVQNGGHDWPHARSHLKGTAGKTNRDFDATTVIFEFMARRGLARMSQQQDQGVVPENVPPQLLQSFPPQQNVPPPDFQQNFPPQNFPPQQ